MKKGLIIKSIGELYTVHNKETGENVKLKPRGNIRYKGQKPKVGDFVEYDLTIDKILPRKNDLIRPPICNIDQAVLVFSAIEPDISYSLLDRFLCLIEDKLIEPVIVITKTGLHSDINVIKENMKYYEKFYKVFYVDSISNQGVDTVRGIFKDKVSVFTGQTGVGKSSLLNALGSFELKTNEISKALGRGKHTTRHTELYELYDGLVADTPGFSSLELIDMDKDDLKESFVDFFKLSNECKYRGCYHNIESTKDCAIKQEVEKGNIPATRYKSYISFLEEIKDKKEKY